MKSTNLKISLSFKIENYEAKEMAWRVPAVQPGKLEHESPAPIQNKQTNNTLNSDYVYL